MLKKEVKIYLKIYSYVFKIKIVMNLNKNNGGDNIIK